MTVTLSPLNSAISATQAKSKTTGKFAPIAKLPSTPSIMPDTSLPRDPQSATVKLTPTVKSLTIQQTSELTKGQILRDPAVPISHPIHAPFPIDPVDEENPVQPIKAPPMAEPPIATDPLLVTPIKYPPIIDPIDDENHAEPVPMQPTLEGSGPYNTKTGKGGIIICNAPETI